MKTGNQVVEMALRRIGVVAEDEAATAGQFQTANTILEGLVAEINKEAPMPWTVATGVPDEAFNPLVMLLSVDVAPMFGLAPLESRGKALARVMATVRQYLGSGLNCCPPYPYRNCMWDYE